MKATTVSAIVFTNVLDERLGELTAMRSAASVLSAHFLPLLESGKIKKILFLSTGALMSPSSLLQGESIYGIAPVIRIEGGNDI